MPAHALFVFSPSPSHARPRTRTRTRTPLSLRTRTHARPLAEPTRLRSLLLLHAHVGHWLGTDLIFSSHLSFLFPLFRFRLLSFLGSDACICCCPVSTPTLPIPIPFLILPAARDTQPSSLHAYSPISAHPTRALLRPPLYAVPYPYLPAFVHACAHVPARIDILCLGI
ncbi:hypothetical protein OH77DRAFT_1072150 [Trametes cingulata]|nr:hypothetical protein OH77DRAFT_1072150 [Trametes cingulata]